MRGWLREDLGGGEQCECSGVEKADWGKNRQGGAGIGLGQPGFRKPLK